VGLDQASDVSRRSLLQAAGGFTFLGLAPLANAARGLEAVSGASAKAIPVFTALPYLQPGTGSSRLVPGQESIVVAWQTNGVPAEFVVTYGPHGTQETAKITTHSRFPDDKPPLDQRVNHAATLVNLELQKRYRYRVTMNGEPLIDGYFTTRKSRGTKTRFVAFGDNSFGDPSDKAIAFQAYQAKPDFVMNTGDNVYDGGLDNEYIRYFFPVYNADEAHIRIGAPLLRAVPFYTVIANHDLNGKDPVRGPAVDFEKAADAGGYFTNMHLPNNAPLATNATPAVGRAVPLARFKEMAGSRFPNMANYSYDYGDAHFTCLDSNVYVDPTDPALQDWIRADIRATDAAWKFVVYHHPAFNAGDDHYDAQHMRALAPLLEELGVDMVLSGHEHTYQRTMPFKFAPRDLTNAKNRNGNTRKVPGTFTVDHQFDGKGNTKPNGVIYITTGAGGKHLYDPGFSDDPSRWLHPEDDNVAYVARFISDRHSLTVFDMDAHSLVMRQIDEWGREVDRIRVTKS
jgi:acid phosphatase type 7